MVDYRDVITLDRSFNLESTLAENATLKKDNKALVFTTIFIGTIALGLIIYLYDNQINNKENLK